MRPITCLVLLLMAVACAPAGPLPNHQQLDFAYCEKLAKETFDSGRIRTDLCPGYMPNGLPNEIP